MTCQGKRDAMTGPIRAGLAGGLGAMLIGALAGLALLAALLGLRVTDARDAGLGTGTVDGITAHRLGRFEFSSTAALDLPALMADRGMARRVLWLGASQLYGINQRKPQDRTAGYRVFDALSAEDTDVGVIGLPNATAREHLVLFARLAPAVAPRLLVLGAVYDDMRHPELRPEIASLAQSPPTAAVLGQFKAGRALLEQAAGATAAGPVRQAERGTTSWMTRSEDWIVRRLEAAFGLETLRREGRAAALLTLHKARGFLESLRFRWTRDLSRYRVPVPADAYARNLDAWSAMLRIAARRGIRVLIYIAPRPSDFFPYDPDGYAGFKRDLQALADRHGGHVVSIEDAVPPAHWGEVDITFGFPARDPFHFRDEGHRLMAGALLPEIRRLLDGVE